MAFFGYKCKDSTLSDNFYSSLLDDENEDSDLMRPGTSLPLPERVRSLSELLAAELGPLLVANCKN